jgi:hypothetical protein
MTYKQQAPSSITVKFVLGLPSSEYERRLLTFEVDRYQDILILPVEENMNNGKTYAYFKELYLRGLEHSFFMKMDDDVYANLTNVEEWLLDMPHERVYFGRQFKGFMVGMAYGLSSDLVESIATDRFPAMNHVGQEDFLVAKWMEHYNKTARVTSISTDRYYDHPDSNKGWAAPFSKDALFIHRCKRNQDYLDAAYYYAYT